MLRVYFHRFPNIGGRYEFKCRTGGVKFTLAMVNEISSEIEALSSLKFSEDEVQWTANLSWMKDAKGFHEFLRLFRFNKDYVKVKFDGNDLKITAEGPIFIVSYFETFVLSIVSEVYFKYAYPDLTLDLAVSKLKEKIAVHKRRPFIFSEFGARRRFSLLWHDRVIEYLKENVSQEYFAGTSDMYLAKKYGVKPQGTQAHEFLCLGQALEGVTLASSQKYMFEQWGDEYRGSLGIALSDTLGIDKFLKDFDLYLAKLFNGIRQDSGDPSEVAEKIIAHYNKLGIDPKTKTIVFSDCLDFAKAGELNEKFKARINAAFGIGTNLICDVGVEPLQCVMKLVEANGRPVAKLSDSRGKLMCEDDAFVKYLRSVL
jgi:nicotinate phosphoribosyltransferase